MTAPLDSTLVAQYLREHPHFFDEHAGLLGEVRLASPLTGRAVSLQERQMEVMRDKYKALELRMADLVRVAQENAAIAEKFHGWTRALIGAFGVPQVTLRLWDVKADHADAWFVSGVSDDARMFANSLLAPYCGSNHDFEAARWLDGSESVQSTVILPLRLAGDKAAFGLLILGSPDPQRFSASMATDFLIHIGGTASAALSALHA